MVTLELNDRLLAAYLFYGSILMLKTWAMSFFTARHRLKNKVLYVVPKSYWKYFCNRSTVLVYSLGFLVLFICTQALPSPEDYGSKNKDKPVIQNADVERVRRAHLNDLENIPVFMIVALLYMFSGRPAIWGIWCLRIFTAARLTHTIAYLNAISKFRGLGFGVGALCTAVLGANVLYSAVKAGVF